MRAPAAPAAHAALRECRAGLLTRKQQHHLAGKRGWDWGGGGERCPTREIRIRECGRRRQQRRGRGRGGNRKGYRSHVE